MCKIWLRSAQDDGQISRESAIFGTEINQSGRSINGPSFFYSLVMSFERKLMIETLVRELAQNQQGAAIPKPEAKGAFRIKGLGIRRGETALIYTIPSHTGNKPYQKGITMAEFQEAYSQLKKSGSLTASWFKRALPACAEEGSCNFTSLGGIFELLGVAKYSGRGEYEFEDRS